MERQSDRSNATQTALVTLLAPIAWGTTYVTITELLPAGRPLLVALLRVLPAGLLLAGWSYTHDRWLPSRADVGRIALLAACNFGLFFPLLVVAVYRLPGGVAASVGGAQPLLVIALGRIFDGRTPRRRDVLLGLIAAAGVALVVVRPGAHVDVLGVLAALGANVAFACGVVATKRFGAPRHRLGETGWQLLIAAAVLAPLVLVVEGIPSTLTGRNVVGSSYLSVVATAGAFTIWFTGVRRLPVQVPPLLGLAGPVVGAVLGWLLLGQSLTVVQLTGFVVVIGAIAYASNVAAKPEYGDENRVLTTSAAR